MFVESYHSKGLLNGCTSGSPMTTYYHQREERKKDSVSNLSGLFWQNHEMITLILSQNVMYFLSTENVF